MNVTTFNPDINVPIWIYFVVAISITAASIFLVWYWGWLQKTGPRMAQAARASMTKAVLRLRVDPIPKGAVARTLAMGGGVATAVGRANLEGGGGRGPNDELMNRNVYGERGE